MDELRFDGQVAIVTGAGGGLGAAHAKLLAARGARVVVNDYGGTTHGTGASNAPADDVVAEIRANGGEAVASYDSVITAAAGLAIVQTALDAFGRVDIVVSNAGISGGGRFGEIPSESVERMVDTHLIGAFNVVQPAWPHLTAQSYGRVVLTSSGSVSAPRRRRMSRPRRACSASLVRCRPRAANKASRSTPSCRSRTAE